MNNKWRHINIPMNDADLASLKSGDLLLLTGTMFTARDKAHQRLTEMAARGEDLPFATERAVIYYAGPTPSKPGRVIGSAGPTTSSRMDPFSGAILSLGIKTLIGKGRRDDMTRKLLVEHRAVYLSSFGGAAAYVSTTITACETIAFEDLGPEGIYKLTVKDFPAVVINDIYGGDLYERTLQH